MDGMRFSKFTWVFLVLVLLRFSIAFGVKIPENSDFIVYFTSFEKILRNFLDDDVLEVGPVTIFGKYSLGSVFELFTGILHEDEDAVIKGLSKLPISIAINPEFSEELLAKNLADMLETSYVITHISQTEKKIQIGEITIYTLKTKDALYISFSELQKRMITDMQKGKLKTIDVPVSKDVDIYYKNFGISPIGNLLYLLGDFYGRPTSEELKVSFNEEKLYFELSTMKNASEYEKNLLKESESYLSELNYAENPKFLVGTTKALPFLVKAMNKELPDKLIDFATEGIDSVLISGNSGLFLSAKYRIEYEKLIENILKEIFQYVEFDRAKSIVNAWQGNEVKSKTKLKELENSTLYLNLPEQEDKELGGITFNVQRTSDGGLKITGNISNFQKYLEEIITKILTEETEEYYDEYEEEYEEEYEDEYEEECWEEATTEEVTTEETTCEECVECEEYEEVFDEEYVYSTAENLANVVDYLIEKLNSGLIPTQWALQYDYPYTFLNRLEFFPAIGKDGTKYLTISFQLPNEEIGEAIISALEDYGISAWIAYGKLIINYVIQPQIPQ